MSNDSFGDDYLSKMSSHTCSIFYYDAPQPLYSIFLYNSPLFQMCQVNGLIILKLLYYEGHKFLDEFFAS